VGGIRVADEIREAFVPVCILFLKQESLGCFAVCPVYVRVCKPGLRPLVTLHMCVCYRRRYAAP
jgi:hypothetical protein